MKAHIIKTINVKGKTMYYLELTQDNTTKKTKQNTHYIAIRETQYKKLNQLQP